MSESSITEEEARKHYYDSLENLKTVITREDLERVKKEHDEARTVYYALSQEFRESVDKRSSEVRGAQLVQKIKVMAKERRAAAERDTQNVYSKAGIHPYFDSLTVGPKLDHKSYVCPKCHTTNLNWRIVNRSEARKLKLKKGERRVPHCLRCNVDMVLMSKREILRLRILGDMNDNP